MSYYCSLYFLTLKIKGGSWEVIDRALGISKRVVTDASVKRWANPVKNSRPTDRHTVALQTLYYSPCWNCCCLFEVKSTHSPCLPGLLTKELKAKYRRHHRSDDEEEYTFIADLSSTTQRAPWRCGPTTTRLAPSVETWYAVCTCRTFGKEIKAAGMVPAFTLLQKESSALR